MCHCSPNIILRDTGWWADSCFPLSLPYCSPHSFLQCCYSNVHPLEREIKFISNYELPSSTLTVTYLSWMSQLPHLLGRCEYTDCWFVVIQENQAVVCKVTVVHWLEQKVLDRVHWLFQSIIDGSLTFSASHAVVNVAEAEFGQRINNEPLIFFRTYWN